MTCQLVVPIATVTSKHVSLRRCTGYSAFAFGCERQRSFDARLHTMQQAQMNWVMFFVLNKVSLYSTHTISQCITYSVVTLNYKKWLASHLKQANITLQIIHFWAEIHSTKVPHLIWSSEQVCLQGFLYECVFLKSSLDVPTKVQIPSENIFFLILYKLRDMRRVKTTAFKEHKKREVYKAKKDALKAS